MAKLPNGWVIILRSEGRSTTIDIIKKPLVMCKDCFFGEAGIDADGDPCVKCCQEMNPCMDIDLPPEWYCPNGAEKEA